MRGVFVFILLLGLAAGVASAQERTVVAIEFEGNRRYTDEFLREQITTKVGEKFDPALLGRDQRTLRDFFNAVTGIDTVEVEGGVKLVFRVIDRVVVGKVAINGLKGAKKADVEPLMTTRRGKPIHEFALRIDEEMIERLEREKGYHFVEVRHVLVKTPHRGVQNVIFQVYPQRRIRVKEVILEGAHSLDRDTILQGASNSDSYRHTFLGIGKIFSPSYFDRAALDRDRRRMELIYHNEGFLDARVALVDIRFDEKQKFATIHYRIDEGDRYRLGALTVKFAAQSGALPVQGDRAFLNVKRLEALATFELGDPFRYADVRSTRRRIQQRLWSRAYAVSEVGVKKHEKPGSRTVDLTYIVYAGSRVRLGRLRILGNQWTRDNVIRRQFLEGAYPGQPLNLEAVERGESALRQLRYFARVQRKGRPPHGLLHDSAHQPDDEYDLEIEVEETSTRSFNIGAAVSTDGGLFANFSLDFRNFDIRKPPKNLSGVFDEDAFRGAGQRLVLSAAPGTTFSSFEVTFADPAVRDSPWSFRGSLARRVARFDTWTQIQDGLSFRVGRFMDKRQRWHARLGLSWRRVTIEDPDANAPQLALDEQGRNDINGMGLTFTYDRRRSLDVVRGFRMTFGGDLYGSFFGGEYDLFKVRYTYLQGWRVYETEGGGHHRLKLNFSTDWSVPFGDTATTPIFERYFAGGRNLRGFEFREVGPRSNGSAEGGQFRSLLSLEYTIPLTDRRRGIGFDLVFFTDQGTNLEEASDLSWDLWRVTLGFGLAIGFGGPQQPPLHIDFGFAVKSVPTDIEQVVSFSFRRDF